MHPIWWKNEAFMTYPSSATNRSTNFSKPGMILQISLENPLNGQKIHRVVGHNLLAPTVLSKITFGGFLQAYVLVNMVIDV